MLPHMAKHVDDIAFLHGMTSRTNTHGPGCVFMNSCFTREGFPTAGSWIGHALGTLNENLPAYVAIQDIRGEPPNGKANWSNGFLPARHQGVAMSAQQSLRNLNPPTGSRPTRTPRHANSSKPPTSATPMNGVAGTNCARGSPPTSWRPGCNWPRRSRRLVERVRGNAHAVRHGGREPAEGRVREELPAREAILERGVRFVSLYCASRASAVDGLLNWDAHKTLKADYERHCPVFDQPTAALITDLRRSGLLDDTLVLWCTEFGRMPTHQEGTSGRDHNPMRSRRGCLGRESEAEPVTARPTNSAAARSSPSPPCTISMPRSCTFWGSITKSSRTITTGQIAA